MPSFDPDTRGQRNHNSFIFFLIAGHHPGTTGYKPAAAPGFRRVP